MSKKAGHLYVVATPIGNLDDISPRAVDVLKSVDLVLAEDTRHSARLLSRFGIDSKVRAFHEHNERQLSESVITSLAEGRDAALISDAGTPLISDPGFHLVRLAHERGVRVIPIPGPSAVVAALSAAGLPTDRFLFEGFLPSRREARRRRLEDLAGVTHTLVILESTHRVAATLEDLAEIFGADRPGAVAKELTKVHETVRTDRLAALNAWLGEQPDRQKGEFVIVVAGAPEADAGAPEAHRALLEALLEELPLKTAVRLAARLSGASKNRLYALALELNGGSAGGPGSA